MTIFRRAVGLTLALVLLPAVALASTGEPGETGDDVTVPVSGTVTDASTGDPVEGVCVAVRQRQPGWWDELACTGADGSYQLDLAPGRYQVRFDDPSDGFGLQWWPAVDSPFDAAWVTVRRGEPVPGIDAELQAGVSFTGRSVEGATGEPMDAACVSVSLAETEYQLGSTVSSADGRWRVSGLPPGKLTVQVARCDNPFRLTWAYDALVLEDAAIFDADPGSTTDVGRLELLAGATVRGTVVAGRGGKVVDDFAVGLDYSGGGRSGEPPFFGADLRPDGSFVIRDVQPGPHVAMAYDNTSFPRSRWADQWSGRATSYGRAEEFVLEPGGSERVDFRLRRGAVLEVTLDGELGEGDYLELDLVSDDYDEVGNRAVMQSGALWGERRTIRLRGIPAAPTAVCLQYCWYDPDGWWYDDVETFEEATMLDLRRGETTSITVRPRS